MKIIQQEKGVTLIELLVVIVLTSILGIILMNILFSSKKQYNDQVSDAVNLNELSYISKEITQDFRQSSILEIGQQSVNFSSASYTYNQGLLKRNNVAYNATIKTFCVASTNSALKTNDCSKLTLPTFDGSKGMYVYIENSNGKIVETTLYSRGGS